MPPGLPSRRDVLHGLLGLTAVALAGGCTSGDDGPDTPGANGGEPDPDLDLLARAIADKQDLLEGYAATTARHTQLAERLAPMRADHEAHLAALTGFRPDLPPPAAGPSAEPSAGPSASASPPGPAVTNDRARAVEDLAAAEHTAANRRIGQCETARDPKLARLLASIGGCEAAHTAVLRSGS